MELQDKIYYIRKELMRRGYIFRGQGNPTMFILNENWKRRNRINKILGIKNNNELFNWLERIRKELKAIHQNANL